MSAAVYKATRRNPVLFHQLHDAYEIDFFYRNLLGTLIEIDLHDKQTPEKERKNQGAYLIYVTNSDNWTIPSYSLHTCKWLKVT